MTIERALRPIRDRIQMMIARGTIASVDDGPKLQALQVELLADETHDQVEHFQPYGLAAVPHAGAEAVALAAGGLRGHAIVLAVADRRYRLAGLQTGEVALYDDQGQQVKLGRDGVVITSAKGITFQTEGDMAIDCANFALTATGKIELNSDDVALGNGATLFAARKTDAVAGGAVSGGSTKVRMA